MKALQTIFTTEVYTVFKVEYFLYIIQIMLQYTPSFNKDGSFIFITIDQVEKSSVKDKTPKLKSKYRFGTLQMSKPVT